MDREHINIFSIEGICYQTYKGTLKKIQSTRSSRLTEALDNNDPIIKVCLFDRHLLVFPQAISHYT